MCDGIKEPELASQHMSFHFKSKVGEQKEKKSFNGPLPFT